MYDKVWSILDLHECLVDWGSQGQIHLVSGTLPAAVRIPLAVGSAWFCWPLPLLRRWLLHGGEMTTTQPRHGIVWWNRSGQAWTIDQQPTNDVVTKSQKINTCFLGYSGDTVCVLTTCTARAGVGRPSYTICTFYVQFESYEAAGHIYRHLHACRLTSSAALPGSACLGWLTSAENKHKQWRHLVNIAEVTA